MTKKYIVVFCTQGVGILLKKWCLLVSKRLGILLLFLIITTVFGSCTYAKGELIELHFVQTQLGDPIALNENEIFYPGGGYNIARDSYDTAKIYNVKKQKLIDTGQVMNVVRHSYGTLKYDDNNILIVGGFCNAKHHPSRGCERVAEIYNIKDNKFTRISDTNLSYINPQMSRLKNGKVFILSNIQFELFDPLTNKFSVPAKRGKYRDWEQRYIYTLHDYSSSEFYELNPDEILILGFQMKEKLPAYDNIAMEILNLKTKKSANLPVDYSKLSYRNRGTRIQLDDGSILFIGAGLDKKDVIKLDAKTKQFTYYNRLSKPLCGQGIRFNQNLVFFFRGVLDDPDYIKTTVLDRAVYDYKNNKIYDWHKSLSKKNEHWSILKLNEDTIIISVFKNNLLLYKY